MTDLSPITGNTQGGCTITVSTSVNTGYTVSFSVGVNIGVISASVDTSFHKSETRGIPTTYSQAEGTTSYVSISPTFDCYQGTYKSCKDGQSDGDACNPRLIGSGKNAQQDGNYSFVYTN
jgi:hypothetical protein